MDSAQQRPRSRLRSLAPITVVMAVCIVSRLALAWWVHGHNPTAIFGPDSRSYHTIASNLVRHGTYSESAAPPYAFNVFRTPGYPGLLAVFYALFGIAPIWVIVFQSLVAGLIALLTFVLGKAIFGRTAGLWAAVIVCLDPMSFCLSQMLLTETFFTLLLLLGIWLLVKALDGRYERSFLALAGLALALATLVRAISYYLIVLLALALLLYLGWRGARSKARDRPWGRAVLNFVIFLIAPVLLLGGWQIYKYVRTGQGQYSEIETVNMYAYRAAEVIALAEHRPFDLVNMEMFRSTADSTGAPVDSLRSLYRTGIRILARHPKETAEMIAIGAGRLLTGPGFYWLARLVQPERYQDEQILGQLVHDLRRPGAIAAELSRYYLLLFGELYSVLCLVFIYLGILVWLLSVVRRPKEGRRAKGEERNSPFTLRNSRLIILAGFVVYFLLVSAGPEAAARFRVPIVPLLSLFSMAGWLRLRPADSHAGTSR